MIKVEGVKPVDGFQRRKEQSKKEIRQAAWALFSQFGVDKVTIVDIARKAGVSQATIYNRFGSKDALVREFVATAIDQLVDQVQEVLAPERPFPDKMAAFIQFISERMAHREPRATGPSAIERTVFTTSLDLQSTPEIAEIRSAAQERMTELLLAVVQEGREQGQVNPALSDRALRVYFGAFMDAFTDPQLQHRFSSDPKLVRDLGALMLSGLRGS
jgi:AcrR family transcriptional regulator